MHAEVFSSARVRLMRPVRLAHPVHPPRDPAHQTRRVTTTRMVRSRDQPAENRWLPADKPKAAA